MTSPKIMEPEIRTPRRTAGQLTRRRLEMLYDFLFSCAVLSLSAPYCMEFTHFGSESAKLGGECIRKYTA